MSVPLWLHCCPQLQPDTVAAVSACLAQGGLRILPGGARREGVALLLFDRVSPALLEAGSQLSGGRADCTVLALCTSAELATGDMWRLLDAGVADVLLWRPGCAEQVLARLQRWQAVRELVGAPAVAHRLIGCSAAWRALVRSVAEVAAFTDTSVLITGETGTGKDLIAQMVHALGGQGGPFTVLDCTTLSPELAGSELFGHERGAFTGAQQMREGAFASANGGTLFLDEVGELPLPLQAQLLRVVQERKYKRVGGNVWHPSSFRLVCATNRDLESEVASGRFRADLYYRLAAWRCRTPPLRERRCDILPLASHFLAELAPDGKPCELDPAVREFLLTRAYPGNVRELRQTVGRMWCRHCGPGPITIGDVPPEERLGLSHGAETWPDAAFEDAVRTALALGVGLTRISQGAAETAIRLVLEEEGDNNQRAAVRLGVSDRALQIRRKSRLEAAVREH
ncbi:MAG TPA: sigma 54-interacting transcriptional regulator [Noviherbaspirillum sp.]